MASLAFREDSDVNRFATHPQARQFKLVFLIGLLVLLTACGFRMRGSVGTLDSLPFQSIYITIDANTAFGSTLRRVIRSSSPNIRLLDSASEPAEVILQQVSESRTSMEVSLNAQGRVDEYELTLTYVFRLVTPDGEVVLPDTILQATRDLPFDDNVVQAKQVEEANLFNQMQLSLVPRIVRRISSPDVAERFEQIKQGK